MMFPRFCQGEYKMVRCMKRQYLNIIEVFSFIHYGNVIKKLESRTLEDIKEDDYQFSLGENFNDGAFLGINTLYYIETFANSYAKNIPLLLIVKPLLLAFIHLN